jgi:hypothetical protein
MAIKIGGTTVIDDSRNLTNLGSAITAAQGGTGLTSPGTAGNVLTSNGTTWTSAAAPASAGAITATASGAISAGNPVVINSDGTVSSAAATYTSSLSNLGNNSSSYAPAGTVIQQSATYDPKGFVVLFYGNSIGYPMVVVGTPSGSTITWGTPTVVYSYGNVSPNRLSTSVYASTADAHMYFTNSTSGEFFYHSVRISSTGAINVIQPGNSISAGNNYWLPNRQVGSFLYDPTNNRLAYVFPDANLAYTYAVGGYCDTSGYFYNQYATIIDSAGMANGPTASYFDTSIARGLIFWENNLNKLWVRTAVLNNSSITLGSPVQVTTAFNNNDYPIAIGKEAGGSGYLLAYINGGSTYTARYATVSGSTVTLGSTGGSWGLASYQAAYLPYGPRALFFSGSTSVSVTVSGGVPSATSYGNLGSNNSFQYWLLDSTNLRLMQIYQSTSNVTGYAVGSGASSNLTSSNLIGFSSASYSNGQTATINTVGSSNSNQSGMAAGTKYYVTIAGALSSTATTQPYAGVALSATKILIKG